MHILLVLLLIFLKIGFLGFGGGYAMLSLIYEETTAIGLTTEQFANLNVLDVLIPGPIAINSATYIGYLFGSFLGALIATLAVATPSFVLIPTMIHFEEKIAENKYLASMLEAIKSAAVGLIFAVGIHMFLEYSLGISNILNLESVHINWFLIVLTLSAWLLHDKFKINPILITIGAGIIGYVFYYLV